MCLSSIDAFFELYDFGTVSSGALMAPCPWFPAAAARCAARPDVEVGIHATLTSEWKGYRWGPVSTRDPDSGLLDAEGYFPRGCEEVQAKGKPDAAMRELAAQTAMVYAAGVDPTHIDTHMGSVAHEKFMEAYIAQAVAHRIPAMLPRPDIAGFEAIVPDPRLRDRFAAYLSALEEKGLPLLDGFVAMPLDEPRDQTETVKRLFGSLPEGITHFILHASTDTPELRAITPDWESRVWNYRTMRSDGIKKFIESEGVILIGYRALRDAMRS
ncbi:MAG: polysaccharide deacetylase family protein, partial [Spirochaetaceae bacterium]|nr:polysaccharide deacetylase family protein [Spirochaetaceae bacterium]